MLLKKCMLLNGIANKFYGTEKKKCNVLLLKQICGDHVQWVDQHELLVCVPWLTFFEYWEIHNTYLTDSCYHEQILKYLYFAGLFFFSFSLSIKCIRESHISTIFILPIKITFRMKHGTIIHYDIICINEDWHRLIAENRFIVKK